MPIELVLVRKASSKIHVNMVSFYTEKKTSFMILMKSDKKSKAKQTSKLVLIKECHMSRLV